ncbi:hypothetical protein [Oceanobacillus polygoni]|uniref:Uncharacterized protein n=1 Tax=Oceanobacillus polygoni TaxID=1235259 RepID=A0A9X0YRQ7_9BACI|nr:hypothetical protein [Oceanobacillus polygoni]MBP2076866.1 hypothetical protein [Oceanobacillus polygoni]
MITESVEGLASLALLYEEKNKENQASSATFKMTVGNTFDKCMLFFSDNIIITKL